jgi:hypothetical protein
MDPGWIKTFGMNIQKYQLLQCPTCLHGFGMFWAYLLWLGQEGCGLGSTQFCSIGLKSSISSHAARKCRRDIHGSWGLFRVGPIKRVACILREWKELGKTIQASLKTSKNSTENINIH